MAFRAILIMPLCAWIAAEGVYQALLESHQFYRDTFRERQLFWAVYSIDPELYLVALLTVQRMHEAGAVVL